MMRANPKRGGRVLIELLFDGEGGLALGQPRAVPDAEYVGVDREGLGPKGSIHYDISCFAPDAGQAF